MALKERRHEGVPTLQYIPEAKMNMETKMAVVVV
jgi:hypothetical protein